jgi:hypothetical protein
VDIALPGTENGPFVESRAFYFDLASRFDQLLTRARPEFARIFEQLMGRPLSNDLWQDVTLAGFDVRDPRDSPRLWHFSVETKGDKWWGITVPFVDDTPQEAVADC